MCSALAQMTPGVLQSPLVPETHIGGPNSAEDTQPSLDTRPWGKTDLVLFSKTPLLRTPSFPASITDTTVQIWSPRTWTGFQLSSCPVPSLPGHVQALWIQLRRIFLAPSLGHSTSLSSCPPPARSPALPHPRRWREL